MSFCAVHVRLYIIGATALSAFSTDSLHRANLQAKVDTKDTDAMVVESTGVMSTSKSASGLIRRHQHQGLMQMDISAAGTVGDEVQQVQNPEDYVLVGDNRCNGGGHWKRYELNSVTPGQYSFCAASCNEKDECVGFDVGTTGCNLYTQKAVAIGTWPGVQFNRGEAFAGKGEHDMFAREPSDLTVGESTEGANDFYKCYRKTFYKPADSYYWLIGNGTCSGGGGAWKRYKLTPGDRASCEHACNLRDECIGFDVGMWKVQESVLQVHQDDFNSALRTTSGCFMYTQKAVHGLWPGVEAGVPLDGDGSHDAFAANPNDLSSGSSADYDVNGETKCYGKSHWVNLQQYYMELGKQTCDGGGKWKHYKMRATDAQECKDKCDEKDECVGLDFVDVELRSEGKGRCRFYTNAAISSGSWADVTFDGAGAFVGDGNHDKHPTNPFSLIPKGGRADPLKRCLAKTHFSSN